MSIRSMMDKIAPHFEKGGKLEKLWPFYESIESVFFAPARVSQIAPNTRDNLDVSELRRYQPNDRKLVSIWVEVVV